MAQRPFVHLLQFTNGLAQAINVDPLLLSDMPPGLSTSLPPGLVDLSAQGITGDGVNCYSAFQNWVNGTGGSSPATANVTGVLPNGTVYLGSGNTLELANWPGGYFSLISFGQTTIKGSVAGPMISVNSAGLNITRGGKIAGNITLNNTLNDPAAITFQAEQVYPLILDGLTFQGNYGCCIGKVAAVATNIQVVLRNPFFNGNLANFPLGIGLGGRAQGCIEGMGNATQCHVALQLANNWTISRFRCEVSDTAIITGTNPDGTSGSCNATINNFTSEANLITATCNGGSSTWNMLTIDGHQRHTSVDGGGVNPTDGVMIQKAGMHAFLNASIGGAFSHAGVYINPALVTLAARFQDTQSGASGGGSAWLNATSSNCRTSNTNSGLDTY